MIKTSRAFLKGFLIGLFIFVLLTALVSHLRSDCGLPAVFGLDYCADDIARAGFPWIFYEEGGFAYRNLFFTANLILDLMVGLIFALAGGFIARRRVK